MGLPLVPVAWRHAHSLRRLVASPDRRLVAGAGTELRVWDAIDGAPRVVVPLVGWAWAVRFAAGGDFVAVSDAEALRVVAVGDGREVLVRPWRVRDVQPDGPHGFVALVEFDGGLEVRDVLSDELRWRIDAQRVRAAALAPGGVAIAASRWGASEVRVHTADGDPVRLVGPTKVVWDEERMDMWENTYTEACEATAEIACLAFDPAGRHVASAGNEAVVRVWDAVTGALVHALDAGAREVGGLAWSADGTGLVATFDPMIGGPGPSRVWAPLGAAPREAAPGSAATFLGDRVLVSAGTRVDVGDGEPREVPLAMAITPTTLLLRHPQAIEAWDRADPPRRRWREPSRDSAYAAIAWASDGTAWVTEASADGTRVRRVDPVRGPLAAAFGPCPTLTWALDVDADGRVAVAGYRRRCTIWEDGAPVARLGTADAHAVRFVADGAWVTHADGTLARFAWAGPPRGDLAPVRTLVPTGPGSDAAPNDDAHVLAISADGTRAISGWNDVVRWWDLERGVVLDASDPVDRFATVAVVGLDPVPFGVVLTKSEGPERCDAWLWRPGEGSQRLFTVAGGLWRYLARGAAAPGGFLLTGGDGVVRGFAVP